MAYRLTRFRRRLNDLRSY